MNTITEKELVDNANNGAVVAIKATKSPDGTGFNLYVNLTWKEGDLLLITQKRKPRTWKSADRLLKHIETNYSEIVALAIFLKHGEDNENSADLDSD